MPKTRNVSRAQWESANASHVSTTSRSRRDKENSHGEEKENASVSTGRATRSQSTRIRMGVLGALGPATNNAVMGAPKATKVLGDAASKLKTATKGKEKPTAAPLKRKKMPLQDITSQFLPAPEPANRGEEHQNLTEEDLAAAHQEPANIISTLPPVELTPIRNLPVHKFTSPLPPSSPPSPFVSSPIIATRKPATEAHIARSDSPVQLPPQRANHPWEEFDQAHPVSHDSPTPGSSNSDPFGFVALERKLKAERQTILGSDADAEGEYDELAHVLVADTSSPRPVRRLKRSFSPAAEEEENGEGAAEATEAVPDPAPAPGGFATPPTPHKDKQKRRRLSHEGHDIFSPCTSSVESSPSPTKASARKRPHPAAHESDPLDEFNDEVERSLDDINPTGDSGKRVKHAPADDESDHDAPSRNLRPRPKKSANNEGEGSTLLATRPTPEKPKGTKKASNKPRSAAGAAVKDKVDTNVESDAEDLDLKWQRERQERVEYFKRLDDYEVEQEDVYFV